MLMNVVSSSTPSFHFILFFLEQSFPTRDRDAVAGSTWKDCKVALFI